MLTKVNSQSKARTLQINHSKFNQSTFSIKYYYP